MKTTLFLFRKDGVSHLNVITLANKRLEVAKPNSFRELTHVEVPTANLLTRGKLQRKLLNKTFFMKTFARLTMVVAKLKITVFPC